MSLEEEDDYSTTYYRCVDPIENFKINIVVEPVKHLHIPLPKFKGEDESSKSVSSDVENEKQERTLSWQEKVLSKKELKECSKDSNWKKKLSLKYNENIKLSQKHLNSGESKLFSYVDVDNYSHCQNEAEIFFGESHYMSPLCEKMKNLSSGGLNYRNYRNISKEKIINYYPSQEFKKKSHMISENCEKMFIMIQLGPRSLDSDKSEDLEEIEEVLCCLSYDYSKSVLKMTPSFSKSKTRPYVIGSRNGSGTHLFYYWIYHASDSIKTESLAKEIQLMNKLLEYQEQIKKLQVDTEFLMGKSNHVYTTILGEISTGQDFEYDDLLVHYFAKLGPGYTYSDFESLMGKTQFSKRNSFGKFSFSHLFEMNLCSEINIFQDLTSKPIQLFFEVISVDKYRRYRNEGYSYITLPRNSGMYKFNLKCWRLVDKSITSQLNRFFIGGGSELEDVSYVGVSLDEKEEVTNRFGLETMPSGSLEIKLNIVHQSENLAKKESEAEPEKRSFYRTDAGSLLGSVNEVLDAFRKARERMLLAKKGLHSKVFDFERSSKKAD